MENERTKDACQSRSANIIHSSYNNTILPVVSTAEARTRSSSNSLSPCSSSSSKLAVPVVTTVPLDRASVHMIIHEQTPRHSGHPLVINQDQKVQILVGLNSLTSILDYPPGSKLYNRLTQFCTVLFQEIIRPASVELHDLILGNEPVDNKMVKHYLQFREQAEETLKGNIPIPPNITPSMETALKEAVKDIIKMARVNATGSSDPFTISQQPNIIDSSSTSFQNSKNSETLGTARSAAHDKNLVTTCQPKIPIGCDPIADYKLKLEADEAKGKDKQETQRSSMRLESKKLITVSNDLSSSVTKSENDDTSEAELFITYRQRQSSYSPYSCPPSPPSLTENDEKQDVDEYDDTDCGSSTDYESEEDSDDEKLSSRSYSPMSQVDNNDDHTSAQINDEDTSCFVAVSKDQSCARSPICLFKRSSDYELYGDNSQCNEDAMSTTSKLSEPISVENRPTSRSPSPPLLCNADGGYTENGDESDVENDPRQSSDILPPALYQQKKKINWSANSDDNRHRTFTTEKRKSRSSGPRTLKKKRTTTQTKWKNNASTTLSSHKDQPSYITFTAKSSPLQKLIPDQKQTKKAKTVVLTTPPSKPPGVVSPASSDAVKQNQPVCNICGKSFSRSDNMQKHKRNVHKIDFDGNPIDPGIVWKCTECIPPIQFAAYNYLQTHTRNFHTNPDACFNCTFCKKEFKTRTGQRQHEKHCRKNPGNKNTKSRKRQQRF